MGSSAFPYESTPDPRIVPHPPRLHWGWVFALSALTRSFFGSVWLVVQANWIRRVTGNSRPMRWAIAHVCVFPVLFLAAFAFGLFAAMNGISWNNTTQGAVEALIGLLILGLYVTANFKVRAALEAEPIGLSLGGVMTFFFGAVYFQFFLHDYVLPDAVDVYGPIPPSPAYVPATLPGSPR